MLKRTAEHYFIGYEHNIRDRNLFAKKRCLEYATWTLLAHKDLIVVSFQDFMYIPLFQKELGVKYPKTEATGSCQLLRLWKFGIRGAQPWFLKQAAPIHPPLPNLRIVYSLFLGSAVGRRRKLDQLVFEKWCVWKIIFRDFGF